MNKSLLAAALLAIALTACNKKEEVAVSLPAPATAPALPPAALPTEAAKPVEAAGLAAPANPQPTTPAAESSPAR